MLKNCEHFIISHQSDKNEKNEKNVNYFNKFSICDLHLNKLHMTIEMKKNSEKVIFKKFQICLENDCNMKKLLTEFNIKS